MGGATLLLLLGGGSGGGAVTPADLVSAIRARFLAAPALDALTKVVGRKANAGQGFPVMVVNLVSESMELTLSRTNQPSWATVQCCVLDTDDARGSDLRDSAYQLLLPNLNAPLVFLDGKDTGARIPLMKWEVEQPGDGRAPSHGAPPSPVWGFYFSYRLYLSRPLY